MVDGVPKLYHSGLAELVFNYERGVTFTLEAASGRGAKLAEKGEVKNACISDHQTRKCACCGITAMELLYAKGDRLMQCCTGTLYCSTDCQSKDYKRHKHECWLQGIGRNGSTQGNPRRRNKGKSKNKGKGDKSREQKKKSSPSEATEKKTSVTHPSLSSLMKSTRTRMIASFASTQLTATHTRCPAAGHDTYCIFNASNCGNRRTQLVPCVDSLLNECFTTSGRARISFLCYIALPTALLARPATGGIPKRGTPGSGGWR